jgi:uncharacterized protein YegL
MAKIEMLNELPQDEIVVILMIDASYSMAGERIGSVNEAMSEVPDQLAKIAENTLGIKLMIAPMAFSNGARWIALNGDKPAEVETFRWIDMEVDGMTEMGAAFKLLKEKLTTEEKGGWMKGRGGAAPVIILISDGGPTDEYKSHLNDLKKRGWFKAAIKFAVAVEGANKDVLKEFTGSDEAIIDTTTVRTNLASVIRTVVVTASQCASDAVSDGSAVKPSEEVSGNSNSDDSNNEAQKKAEKQVNVDLKSSDLF